MPIRAGPLCWAAFPRAHTMPPALRLPGRASYMSWLLLVLGIAGFTALWVTLGSFNARLNSWMAVLAALDIVLMLRLGRWPAGPGRRVTAVVATTVIVVAANWGIIAANLGHMLGLMPVESAFKLGVQHAWVLARLANGPLDLVWIAVALVVAAVGSR